MEKMSFRKWIENFWYHNKFAVIVILVFVIFISVSLAQLFTKKSPDANFLYMGPAAVAFSGENLIQESMAEIMSDDYNYDGTRYIDYIELTTLDAESDVNDTDGDFATGYTSMQVQQSVGEAFSAHIIAGDSMIYLLDDKYFNIAENTGVLMPLKEALGYTPSIAVNDYAVYLCDLDVYKMPGLNLLPKSTLLCIRYPVTLTAGKTKVEERERCNLNVFRDMFNYDLPEEEKLPEPTVLTLDGFKTIFADYSVQKQLDVTQEEIEASIDITPDGFFDMTGANLFKVGNATYLTHYNAIYALGKHIGGDGIIDVDICNFDLDEQNDVIFTYTFGNSNAVVSSASIFNIATKKETFLSLESELPLSIEKTDNGEFNLVATDELGAKLHSYTVSGKDGKFEITIKDV